MQQESNVSFRNEILKKILEEREKQINRFGSEMDSENTPGDWVSLVIHYASEEVKRNGVAPSSSEFENSLIKAAAIIIAAIEHISIMKGRNQLRDD